MGIERVGQPGWHGPLASASPAGPVYVVSGSGLHAVDWDGQLRWSRSGGALHGQPRVALDGGVWLLDGAALVETTASGAPGRRVDFSHTPDERIGTFVVLPDGFIVAWQSDPIRVERTDESGVRRWSAELLPYEGVTELGAANGWRPELRAGLLVSSDRVLATCIEYSSGIGMGFCLDLATGDLVWVTPPHPAGERAIAGPGRFLVGSHGYDAFTTWLFDRDGATVAEWPSHGGLLVSSRGRIRVVEEDNAPSAPQRVRRLHRDGSMTDGPRLPGYYTVGPVLSRDGRAAFWRDGKLQIMNTDLSVHTLYEGEGKGVGRMLLLEGGRLFFTLATGRGSLVYADTDLPPLDTGVWPCAESNLQANPVQYW